MLLTTSRTRAVRARMLLSLATGFGWAAGAGLEPASAQEPGAAPAPAAARAKAGARPVPEALNFANALFHDRRYELAAEQYERFLKDAPAGPDADAARFGLANARLFQGQYARARTEFEAFLKAVPAGHSNALTAQYRVGETSYMLGDLPAARRALERFTAAASAAAGGHRNLETAWPYLGEVCLRMHDLPRARQAYEQSLKLHPRGRLADRARFGLGRTLALQGKTAEAVKLLTELAEHGGGDWTDRAWLQIGQAELEAGRLAEAVQAFETLERVAPRSPLVPESRLSRADALVKLDRRDDAEKQLRTLLDEAPPNLAAQAAFSLGTAQLGWGKPAEAIETLDQAAKRFADTAMAPALVFRSAEAAQKLGKSDDARARFLKAAELDPKHAWADDALIRAARIALEARDNAAARTLADSFATRFPDSPLRGDAHLIAGQAAYAEGHAREAIAILRAALAEDKPAPETAQAALYYLGLAYRADGQKAKAEEVLDSLAKTPAAPAAANAQYLVGQAHFEAKRYAEAIPALEKYLEGNPQGEVAANALTFIVWARLELGQLDEAAGALAQLAERAPRAASLPATRLRLAWALLEKDRAAEAAAAFAALLATAPDDRLAPEAALGRGQALRAAKQNDEALKAFALVSEKYPKTEQATQADLARARLLVDAKRPAEAAELFARYLENRPETASGPSWAAPDGVLSEWAWALVDAGKPAEADPVFARLLKEHPESTQAADARLVLAQSAYDARKYDEAVALLEPLAAEGSKAPARLVPPALFLLARTQDKRKDLDAAAQALDRLNRDFPDHRYRREARFLRADVALRQGDAKAAEAEFAALAAEPPAETDPERFGVVVRRGRIRSLVALKRWKDVLEAADAFKKETPRDLLVAEVDYDRGRALQQLARFDEARAAYQAVIDARKGGDLAARAQLMRGECYFWQKNYKEALLEYFRVAKLYDAPTWQAAALLEAGKVYERLDQWAVAAETYQELLTNFPSSDPSAVAARSRLEAARRHASAPSSHNNTQTR